MRLCLKIQPAREAAVEIRLKMVNASPVQRRVMFSPAGKSIQIALIAPQRQNQ